jgi:hypothetical protein
VCKGRFIRTTEVSFDNRSKEKVFLVLIARPKMLNGRKIILLVQNTFQAAGRQ